MLFECHITCDLKGAEAAEEVAKQEHWKTSEIARDPVLGQASYFYLTSHERNYARMHSRMERASAVLKAAGVEVLREKIEAILYDTKSGEGVDHGNV